MQKLSLNSNRFSGLDFDAVYVDFRKNVISFMFFK
jgi:hypothetical protein